MTRWSRLIRCSGVCMLLASMSYGEIPITGNVNVLAGRKHLDAGWMALSNVPPVDIREQDEYGIMLDARCRKWPVNVVVDFLSAKSGDHRNSIKTTEIDYGFRKYFGEDRGGIPYIGAGLGQFRAEGIFMATERISASNSGYWAEGGVVFKPLTHINLGLDLRYSSASVQYRRSGVDFKPNIGGMHIGIFAGYSF